MGGGATPYLVQFLATYYTISGTAPYTALQSISEEGKGVEEIRRRDIGLGEDIALWCRG